MAFQVLSEAGWRVSVDKMVRFPTPPDHSTLRLIPPLGNSKIAPIQSTRKPSQSRFSTVSTTTMYWRWNQDPQTLHG